MITFFYLYNFQFQQKLKHMEAFLKYKWLSKFKLQKIESRKELVLRKIEVIPNLNYIKPAELKIDFIQMKEFADNLIKFWVTSKIPVEGVDTTFEFKHRDDFGEPPKKRQKADWEFANQHLLKPTKNFFFKAKEGPEKLKPPKSDIGTGVRDKLKDKDLKKTYTDSVINDFNADLEHLKTLLSNLHTKQRELENPSLLDSKYIKNIPTIEETVGRRDIEDLDYLFKKIIFRDTHVAHVSILSDKFPQNSIPISEEEKEDYEFLTANRIIDEIGESIGITEESHATLPVAEPSNLKKKKNPDAITDPEIEKIYNLLEKLRNKIAKAQFGDIDDKPETSKSSPSDIDNSFSNRNSYSDNAESIQQQSSLTSRALRKRKYGRMKPILKQTRPFNEECSFCLHDTASCACSVKVIIFLFR